METVVGTTDVSGEMAEQRVGQRAEQMADQKAGQQGVQIFPKSRWVLLSVCLIGLFSITTVNPVFANESPLLIAQATAASKADEKAQKKAQKKEKNKRVCRYIKETGSRIKERVCRKQKDWDRLEERGRESAERAKEGGTRNTAQGGP